MIPTTNSSESLAELTELLHKEFPGYVFEIGPAFIHIDSFVPLRRITVGTPKGEWIKLKTQLHDGVEDDVRESAAILGVPLLDLGDEIKNMIFHEIRQELETL